MIKPLYDKVVILLDKQTETTQGGIIVPTVGNEVPQTGTVVATGPGRINEYDYGHFIPLTVQVGNKVVVGRWEGTTLNYEGREYFMTKESQILAVID